MKAPSEHLPRVATSTRPRLSGTREELCPAETETVEPRQWHRLFACGTLPDGQGAALEPLVAETPVQCPSKLKRDGEKEPRLHWSEEDGYGYKVTWVKGWIGPTSPKDFTTTRVKRDYIFSNAACGLQ